MSAEHGDAIVNQTEYGAPTESRAGDAYDVVVSSPVSTSPRVRQLESLFDVPPANVEAVHWSGRLPFQAEDWKIGLVVGPSGSGKSTLMRHVFGDYLSEPTWSAQSVIDDFGAEHSMSKIADVCRAVGFNTIPAWRRPYRVLSNGEQFRVDMARRLLTSDPTVAVDEFTSVVDRQVAQIAAHAVQKYVRKQDSLRFVAASVHYDIIDWLQPDWVLEMPQLAYERRSLQRRPALDVTISRVPPRAAWPLFAPFHYLTNHLHNGARTYVLFVGDRPASMAAILHRPHAIVDDIEGISRTVTLPDWQGLGLAMVLTDYLGAAYKAIGKRLHGYPSHPSLIRSRDNSPNWSLIKKPGSFSTRSNPTVKIGLFGGRACAVFGYVGPPFPNKLEAQAFLDGYDSKVVPPTWPPSLPFTGNSSATSTTVAA